MISLNMFNNNEAHLIGLAQLWNRAEQDPQLYDKMYRSNPHELAVLIGNNTTFSDWQIFLTDTRVQNYVDSIIYAQAGILINKFMDENLRISVSETTRLNAAIKYREDNKDKFAPPTQYIYIQTPLSPGEKEFLPKVPENEQ